MSPFRTCFAACTLATATVAAPHDPGLSSLQLRRTPAGVTAVAAFANADFELAAAIDRDGDRRIDAAELAAAVPALRERWSREFVVLVAGEQHAATLRDARLAENRDVELQLAFDTVPGAGPIHVEAPFLRRLSAGHRCYAAWLGADDTVLADALLRPEHTKLALPTDAAIVAAGGFAQSWEFFVLGIEHILIGFDHLAFLLAVLVGGLSWRRVVATVTAFTAAHSLTLLGAALGLVRLPGTLVEATIAGSIVVVAAANLCQRGRAVHRWPLAFGFGLVHGFGFAGVLADLAIGGPAAIAPLLTFNLGVEVGQLAFALAVVPPLAWATRSPRGRCVPALVSVVVGVAGLVWLGQRVV